MSDLLLTYCGDDFTGSTDVMEALATAGLRTVLFLEPPSPGDLRRFDGLRAAGVAATSRAMTPAQMDRALPDLFGRLKALGAPVCHYKVCSTFDSSPRSARSARDQRSRVSRPLHAARRRRPVRRYCLFTRQPLRHRRRRDVPDDRHPAMSRHPVTPMDEGDLGPLARRRRAASR
jgi:uncharacterized protein YgbK (DUF1537 family)